MSGRSRSRERQPAGGGRAPGRATPSRGSARASLSVRKCREAKRRRGGQSVEGLSVVVTADDDRPALAPGAKVSSLTGGLFLVGHDLARSSRCREKGRFGRLERVRSWPGDARESAAQAASAGNASSRGSTAGYESTLSRSRCGGGVDGRSVGNEFSCPALAWPARAGSGKQTGVGGAAAHGRRLAECLAPRVVVVVVVEVACWLSRGAEGEASMHPMVSQPNTHARG